MRNREISEKRLGLSMISLPMLLLLFFAFIPIIYLGYLSTQDIQGLINRGFVGLDNYREVLATGRLQSSLTATVLFSLGTIAVQMVVSMIIALALNVKFKGRNIVRSIILIPWAIPTVMVGIMWSRFLAGTDGYVNATLRLMGILDGEFNWFLRRGLALLMVILVDSWKFTPIFVMIFLAGLQGIPSTLYEAAIVDGASKFQKFWHITLPLMKPVIMISLIMRTIFSLRAFDLIFILTQGGPGDATRVLSFYAYQETFSYLRRGHGASIAFMLLILTAIITILYVKIGTISKN